MKVQVRVQFEGTVEVEVPNHLSPADQKTLTEKLAVAQILATATNPDCGEALEVACEEFVEETDGAEADFDSAKIVGISGVWSVQK